MLESRARIHLVSSKAFTWMDQNSLPSLLVQLRRAVKRNFSIPQVCSFKYQIIVVVVVVVVVVVLQFVVVVAVSVVVVVVVVHALTRITKSVVAGQAPGTLELRNSPGKKHKQPKNGTRIYNS